MTTANRRGVLAGILPTSVALLAALTETAALTAPLVGDENTRTWLRLVSDLSGRTTFAIERGDVWGFKPQGDDLTAADFARRLYGYWSLVVRKTALTPDAVMTLHTKAWTFYLSPDTEEIVTDLVNPYTGQTVHCPPLSGPVSALRFDTPKAGDNPVRKPLDLRHRRMGDRAWVEIDQIARFRPADTTWFKLEADLVSYACSAANLDDKSASFLRSTWSHNVVAEWQTWMHMHGTPGHILFKGDGAFVKALDAAPPPLLAAIERNFPADLGALQGWG